MDAVSITSGQLKKNQCVISQYQVVYLNQIFPVRLELKVFVWKLFIWYFIGSVVMFILKKKTVGCCEQIVVLHK